MGSVTVEDGTMVVEGFSLKDIVLEIDSKGRDVIVKDNHIVLTGGPKKTLRLSLSDEAPYDDGRIIVK